MDERDFKRLPFDKQIDHLLSSCLKHPIFSASDPPFDRTVFEVLASTNPPTMIRRALIEMHEYYSVLGKKKKNWRRTLMNWVRKNRRYEEARLVLQEKRAQSRTDGGRAPSSYLDRCKSCRRIYDKEHWGSPRPGICWECHVRDNPPRST